MVKTKFRTQYSTVQTRKHTPLGESKTKPGLAINLKTVVERSRAGIPPDIAKTNVWQENPSHDNFQKFIDNADLTDLDTANRLRDNMLAKQQEIVEKANKMKKAERDQLDQKIPLLLEKIEKLEAEKAERNQKALNPLDT